MKSINPRSIAAVILFAGALSMATGCQTVPHAVSTVQTRATQTATTPAAALEKLKEGNQRFVAGQSLIRDYPAQVRASSSGQYPFAVILSCIDSRCSPEQIFDQGVGDIFDARVAGNVLNDDILGSMEFACQLAGAKLIMVVGHTKCGAIKGAASHTELGHLTGLLAKIEPVVTGKSPAEIDAAAVANVKRVLEQIRERSPILAGMISRGEIALAGGISDLDTGRVDFFK